MNPKMKNSEMLEELRELAIDYQHDGRGEVLLLPYDDRLVYRNGHTELTEGGRTWRCRWPSSWVGGESLLPGL